MTDANSTGIGLFRRALTEKGLKLSRCSHSLAHQASLFRRALTEKGLKPDLLWHHTLLVLSYYSSDAP